jgi:FKBP-type peptidyl-prolyl cis-trans isomerase
MRRSLALALFSLTLAAPAAAQNAKPAPPAQPAAPSPADTDKALYALGLAISESLKSFTLTPAELEKVMGGLRDGAAGKGRFPFDQKAQQLVSDLAKGRFAAAAEKEKAKGAAYLEKSAKEKGAVKTAGGAVVIPLAEGKGATPAPTDTVKVHYTGTLVDGKVFDSSRQRGQPAEFPLNQVVPCWTEAFQKIKVGGKAKIVCPSSIAYGEQGRPPVIPGNAVLTFDIELLDIVKAPPPAGAKK